MQCFAERGGGASVGGSFCFSDPTRQATSSSHSSVKKIGLNAIEKESREDKYVGCQGILMSSLTSKEMQWVVRSINLKILGANSSFSGSIRSVDQKYFIRYRRIALYCEI